MKASISIKTAVKTELPRILELVQGLAEFEKEPTAVTAQISDYEKAFEDNLIWVNTARQEDRIIGFVLAYETFSTWKGKMFYLEDFYVMPELRSLGVGQILFDSLLNEAKTRECKLVKWQVLDWNKEAIRFYEKNHAIIDKQWYNGKIIF